MSSNALVFPENESFWRSMTVLTHILGVSFSAWFLAHRLTGFSWTKEYFSGLTLTRWLVFIVFIDSWLFHLGSALLVSGIGLSLNTAACQAAIYLCALLYAVGKLFIYTFLAEKVYVVHSYSVKTRRSSNPYRLCLALIIGYLGILMLMIHGRIGYIRDGHAKSIDNFGGHIAAADNQDGACIIGLARPSSIAVLVYDLIVNIFFTFMFIYPVYRLKHVNPRLRRVAQRTLIAASVALLCSVANFTILTIVHGQELGWVCLLSCGWDVTVNAAAVFVVTAPADESADSAVIMPGNTSSANRRRISAMDARKPESTSQVELKSTRSAVNQKASLTPQTSSIMFSDRDIVHDRVSPWNYKRNSSSDNTVVSPRSILAGSAPQSPVTASFTPDTTDHPTTPPSNRLHHHENRQSFMPLKGSESRYVRHTSIANRQPSVFHRVMGPLLGSRRGSKDDLEVGMVVTITTSVEKTVDDRGSPVVL